MPVKSNDIPWEEIGQAALPTLLPVGLFGLGWYIFSQKREQELWFKSLRKPSWVIEDKQICGPLEFAVMAPIGYASHLIMKEARASERQMALGLYGAGLLTWAAAIPAFSQTKDLKLWFGVSTLAAGLFGATAFTFYKVNNTAGLMVVPLAAWCAYGAISMFALMQHNPNAGTDWTPKK